MFYVKKIVSEYKFYLPDRVGEVVTLTPQEFAWLKKDYAWYDCNKEQNRILFHSYYGTFDMDGRDQTDITITRLPDNVVAYGEDIPENYRLKGQKRNG
jgi:hypothetical protein